MSDFEDWLTIKLHRIQSSKLTREQKNALIVSGGFTLTMFITLLLASLVFLAMPRFSIETFTATIVVGLCVGVATPLIVLQSPNKRPRLDMLRKIAIVEGIASLAALPINAGTTYDLILLLLATISYAAVITVVCLRAAAVQRQQDDAL